MKRVLMLFSHPLFGHGVERLLCGEPGLEVVGRETDAHKVMERFKELRPDVVIVDGADRAGDAMPDVMHILREGKGAKVIVLNLQDNTMCVYRREQRMVKGVEDLVQAILEPSRPDITETYMPGVVKEPEQETKAR